MNVVRGALLWIIIMLWIVVIIIATVVWDSLARHKIYDIKLIQNCAILFISNMKWCIGSVSEAKTRLQIQSLEERITNWHEVSGMRINTTHYLEPMKKLLETDS